MTATTRRPPLALLLVSELPEDPGTDDLETLEQAKDIAAACERLGFATETLTFSADLTALRRTLDRHRPAFVVNLVETLFGRGGLTYVAPALLEDMGLPFLGAGSAGLYMTTHKLIAKRLLRAERIATPDWAEAPAWSGLDPGRRYIVKCATEDASIGIDSRSVVLGRDAITAARARARMRPGDWFAEAFIDGREFNVTVLDGPEGPQVMPLAETLFENFPADRPRIVDYAAKWDPEDHAYQNTPRAFLDAQAEPALAARLAETVRACWRLFGLKGWARVDMRVEADGTPYVIDVNANPDLSQGVGVASAAAEAGLTYDALIARIIGAAFADGERR